MVPSHDWIYFAITPFIQLIIVAWLVAASRQQKLGTYIRSRLAGRLDTEAKRRRRQHMYVELIFYTYNAQWLKGSHKNIHSDNNQLDVQWTKFKHFIVFPPGEPKAVEIMLIG